MRASLRKESDKNEMMMVLDYSRGGGRLLTQDSTTKLIVDSRNTNKVLCIF